MGEGLVELFKVVNGLDLGLALFEEFAIVSSGKKTK
jgi:hypothetical protein